MSAPRPAADLLVERFDDGEAVVYLAEEGSLHRLDVPAALVLELLDGERDVEGVVDALVALTDAPREVLEHDVAALLEQLLELGVVVQEP